MKKNFKLAIATILGLTVAAVAGFSLGMNSKVYAFGTYTTPSPYAGVAYSAYYHNADMFSNCLILNGVDVSEYQSGSKSDWGAAKANAVDFSIARVTWTGYGSSGTKHADENFKNHYNKGKAAGVMMGVYVFSQATSEAEARAEATYAIQRLQALGIGPNDLDLPIYMDYEFAGPSSGSDKGRLYGKLSKSKGTANARAFCETIEAAGYEAGLYACTSFLNSYIDSSFGNTYDVWCAQYYNKCEYTGVYDMWQYSSAAKIPGINNTKIQTTSADVNFWYLNPNRTSTDSSDIASCSFNYDGDQTEYRYTGGAVCPNITVKSGEKVLANGTEYKVTYFRNVSIGTGYALIKGKGGYKGYKLLTFTIKNAYENIGLAGLKSEESLNVSLTEQASAAGYTVDETNISGVIPGTTARALKGIIQLNQTLVDAGYTFTINDAGTGVEIGETSAVNAGNLVNFYRPADAGAGETAPVRVASLNINTNGGVSATPAVTAFYYDGGAKTPGIYINFGNMNVASNAYSGNDLVNISYPGGCVLPGTYVAYFSGNGMFEGVSGATSFNIIVKPTTIKSLSKKKAGFKAKWYKQAKTYVSGYQIQYSRYSNMSNDLKKTMSSYKTSSKTVTKRYRKKTYYVRVRTYKTINKVKYYSDWSPIKTVKTK